MIVSEAITLSVDGYSKIHNKARDSLPSLNAGRIVIYPWLQFQLTAPLASRSFPEASRPLSIWLLIEITVVEHGDATNMICVLVWPNRNSVGVL